MSETAELERLRQAMRMSEANYRDAWAALRLIRTAVEELAPVGAVPNGEYLDGSPDTEARAIIEGIKAIAAR